MSLKGKPATRVIADAAVSVLVIVGPLLARAFGWLLMDPLAGIVGACVVASWSYGLIRDTSTILLDVNPDQDMAGKLRQAIEADGDQIADLHLWRWSRVIAGRSSRWSPRGCARPTTIEAVSPASRRCRT
jgi:Co/Zn/Cd efflux system component